MPRHEKTVRGMYVKTGKSIPGFPITPEKRTPKFLNSNVFQTVCCQAEADEKHIAVQCSFINGLFKSKNKLNLRTTVNILFASALLSGITLKKRINLC